MLLRISQRLVITTNIFRTHVNIYYYYYFIAMALYENRLSRLSIFKKMIITIVFTAVLILFHQKMNFTQTYHKHMNLISYPLFDEQNIYFLCVFNIPKQLIKDFSGHKVTVY